MKTQTFTLTNEQIVKLAPAAGATAPHEMVSDRYSFVPTIEAVELLRSVGWLPVAAKQAGVRNDDRDGFQKHMIRFIQEGMAADEERIDLVLNNSHDRGCAFKLAASVWRKICENGLMVSSGLYNFSHKHIGFDSHAFIDSAYKIADGAGESAENILELSSEIRNCWSARPFPSSYSSMVISRDKLAALADQDKPRAGDEAAITGRLLIDLCSGMRLTPVRIRRELVRAGAMVA